MTETQEKVERKLEEVLEKFDFDELSEEEELHEMCENCEAYFGQCHDYSECKDKMCFKFFLAYYYLQWAASWE